MDEVVQGIMKIHETLSTRKMDAWTGDELSRAMSELAMYKMSLGSYVAELERDYSNVNVARKLSFARQVKKSRDMKLTVGESEQLARIFNEDLYSQENEAKYNYEVVRNLYRDTNELISTFQSRLAFLRSEQFQQKDNIDTDDTN